MNGVRLVSAESNVLRTISFHLRPARGRGALPAVWIWLALCLFIAQGDAGQALAQSRKPRVPPGLDPGGVAVAIAADTGIDYTAPMIAQRIARDGEGELIGWDFVDDDRRPFEPAVGGVAGPTTALAQTILREAAGARVAMFRAKLGDKIALGRLAVYVARSPARIALVTVSSPDRADWDAFAEVVTHFKGLLVIAPAEPAVTTYPAALGLDTILVVTAHEHLGAMTATAAHGAAIDVAVPSGDSDSRGAAARIAALAARLLAAEPRLDGAALKARILALAKPLPALQGTATRHGWIAEPHNAFP